MSPTAIHTHTHAAGHKGRVERGGGQGRAAYGGVVESRDRANAIIGTGHSSTRDGHDTVQGLNSLHDADVEWGYRDTTDPVTVNNQDLRRGDSGSTRRQASGIPMHRNPINKHPTTNTHRNNSKHGRCASFPKSGMNSEHHNNVVDADIHTSIYPRTTHALQSFHTGRTSTLLSHTERKRLTVWLGPRAIPVG